MKYGRATTDLHAKSKMHHQTNIAIQTNVCTSYSDTEAKQKYSWFDRFRNCLRHIARST